MSTPNLRARAHEEDIASLHRELANLIVTALKLEMTASDLTPERPLFGENSVGLDSIDALEIALHIEHSYGIKIQAEDEDNEKRFFCVASLAEFIVQARAAEAMTEECSVAATPLRK